MHVEKIGDGDEHVLCLHGWGGGWRTFLPLKDDLPNCTLWSVDLPGYGNSPPPARYDWAVIADAILEVAEQLPSPLTLLGNCSGAAYGLMAALQRPQFFDRLVLIDPFAFFPWYFKLLAAPTVGRLFYATAFENRVGRWVTNARLAEHRRADTDLTASFEQLDHDVVYNYLRMLRAMPPYTVCAALKQPVTLIIGEHTFPAVRQSVQCWREVWPDMHLVELAGAGHLPIQEAPQQLAAAVRSRGGTKTSTPTVSR